MRQYTWLARSKPILLLLTAWCLSYAGDLAAFTAASVYAYRAGGAGLVAVLGLLKALPGAFLVPAVTSGSDRVRRERLLIATVVPRALLLGVAAAAMAGGGQGVLVVVLVGLEGGLASAFRQVQAALLHNHPNRLQTTQNPKSLYAACPAAVSILIPARNALFSWLCPIVTRILSRSPA